jgi:peptide/nickel transport system permease protein
VVRFVLKRLAFAVVLVLVVTSASFVLVHVVPGDYFTRFGPGADLRAHAERAAAGFDRPLPVRYAEWLGRAMRLDLGTSLKFQQPVAPLVMRRAMNTALLGTCALVAATLLGLSLGVFTGSGDRVGHRLVGMASSATLAIPPLVWSLGTTALTARLGWLPPAGLRLSNLVVPAIALAVPAAAWVERIHSRAVRRALHAPHILAARARGIASIRVLWLHASREAMGTTLSTYGVLAGTLLSGSLVVETIADWPGLGMLTADALRSRDLYLVCGCSAAAALILAVTILACDLLHLWADPRLRAS